MPAQGLKPRTIAAGFVAATIVLAGASGLVKANSPIGKAERIRLDNVPIPHQVHSRSGPLRQGKTALVALDTVAIAIGAFAGLLAAGRSIAKPAATRLARS